MQETERKLALAHLSASRERLLGAVQGLLQEQWAYRPAADRWSPADCVEHLIVVERSIFNAIKRKLEAPERENIPELREKDQIVLDQVPSRDRRVQGPEEMMPSGRWPDTAQLIQQFSLTRASTIDFAAHTQADLRRRYFRHPFLGDLDCYQWLLFLGTHCERHVRQMEEVMADAGFPRSLPVAARFT